MAISKGANEKLDLLKGSEVNSIHYEGCVGIINGNEVWMRGEKVDTLDSSTKINRLFRELLKEEGF